MENVSAILEALILSSESPLPLEKICAVLDGVDKTQIREELDKLIAGYEERQSGIGIQEVAGGFQFRTQPAAASWVKKLKGTKPTSLSPAALETLAIVAYRQPIVKSEIESIRGVDVGAPLKGLLDKKLIRIVGRKDVPGKPIIYGTTKKFLEVFNLKELTDLPTMRELKEITEHQEIYEQETIAFEDDEQEMNQIEEAHTASEPTQIAESAEAPETGQSEVVREPEGLPLQVASEQEESQTRISEDDTVS